MQENWNSSSGSGQTDTFETTASAVFASASDVALAVDFATNPLSLVVSVHSELARTVSPAEAETASEDSNRAGFDSGEHSGPFTGGWPRARCFASRSTRCATATIPTIPTIATTMTMTMTMTSTSTSTTTLGTKRPSRRCISRSPSIARTWRCGTPSWIVGIPKPVTRNLHTRSALNDAQHMLQHRTVQHSTTKTVGSGIYSLFVPESSCSQSKGQHCCLLFAVCCCCS